MRIVFVDAEEPLIKPAILITTILALSAVAGAQNTDKPFKYNGNGYTYFSAGACQHGYANLGGGGGGEGFVWRGLTLGGDVGYFKFPADYNNGYGVATLNVGYHFVDRTRPKKLDPYLDFTVLGVAFKPGSSTGAGHLGGGVNYWFKERIGLHTGVQVQIVGEDAVASFRVGLTFR